MYFSATAASSNKRFCSAFNCLRKKWPSLAAEPLLVVGLSAAAAVSLFEIWALGVITNNSSEDFARVDDKGDGVDFGGVCNNSIGFASNCTLRSTSSLPIGPAAVDEEEDEFKFCNLLTRSGCD